MHSRTTPRPISSTATAASSTWDGTRPASRSSPTRSGWGSCPRTPNSPNASAEIPAWDSLDEEQRSSTPGRWRCSRPSSSMSTTRSAELWRPSNGSANSTTRSIFVTSDNGASGEGGLAGTFNETYVLNGLQTPFDANMRPLDSWGEADTYPHYHAGWAMAGNTPFRYFKQSVHRGGHAGRAHRPLAQGNRGTRRDPHPVHSHRPTSPRPSSKPSASKWPEESTASSRSPSTASACATPSTTPTPRPQEASSTTRCSATARSGPRAGRRSRCTPIACPGISTRCCPFDDDKWELYHVAEDFSESTDLAAEHPEKLAELRNVRRGGLEVQRLPALRRHDHPHRRSSRIGSSATRPSSSTTRRAPYVSRRRRQPPVKDRSHAIVTTVDLQGGEEGVIVACGGIHRRLHDVHQEWPRVLRLQLSRRRSLRAQVAPAEEGENEGQLQVHPRRRTSRAPASSSSTTRRWARSTCRRPTMPHSHSPNLST